MYSNAFCKNLKRIFVILIVGLILITFLVSPLLTKASEDKVYDRVIKVGYFSLDGFNNQDEYGKRSGYGFDMLARMSCYGGMKFEFYGYDKNINEAMEMLERGEVDIVNMAYKSPDSLEKFEFSSSVINTTSVVITKRAEDSSIVPRDINTYKGKKIGLVEGSSSAQEYLEFEKNNGLNLKKKTYTTVAEQREALFSKEIDLIATQDFRNADGEAVVETLGSKPFFIVARKGDTELMNAIDMALSELSEFSPGWREELVEKYITLKRDELNITNDERNYIKKFNSEKKTLKVLAHPDMEPYSYFENGEAKGILPEIFKSAAATLGIHFEFIKTANKDEYDEAIKNNIADVVIDNTKDLDSVFELGYRKLEDYYTSMVSLVSRDDFRGIPDTVAVVEGTFDDNVNNINGSKIIIVNTVEDAFDAVKNGKVDGAYICTYAAQQYLKDDYKHELTSKIVSNVDVRFSLMMDADSDYRLLSSLTKAIMFARNQHNEVITAREIESIGSEFSLGRFLYENPIVSLVGALLIIAFVAACIVSVLLRKHKNAMIAKNEALADALYAANRAAESKDAFLSSISHEIRTPLNAILGYLKIARENIGNTEKIESTIDNSEIAARHLLELVSEVLDNTAIEKGKLKLAQEEFNIREFLQDLWVMFNNQARGKDIVYNVYMKDFAIENVIGDKMRLNQILMNLLSNAFKFTPKGGRITLNAVQMINDEESVNIKFEVSDTGIGMSEEYLEKMFTPFEQEEASTSRKYGGSGLGLSITKNLVNLMRGTIDVKSKKDEGSTFTVVLNLKKGSLDNGVQSMTGSVKFELEALKGMKILLVEDNDMNLEIAKEILTETGFVVDEARNGKEAVEKFEASLEDEYDAILMDIQMPIMDGYEATKLIRESSHPKAASVPIIAMTANAFAEDVSKSLSYGMNAHVAKPIDFDKLYEVLAKYR